jgi:hypothetical protein
MLLAITANIPVYRKTNSVLGAETSGPQVELLFGN